MKSSTIQHTILIVDDEVDLRDALDCIFQSFGYQTLLAGNGKEAFEIAKTNKVDAIITDVRMPVMDGVDLLKNIRSLHPNLPIVFLITGYADISEVEAKNLGANGLVHKPFSVELIIQQIEKALNRSEI